MKRTAKARKGICFFIAVIGVSICFLAGCADFGSDIIIVGGDRDEPEYSHLYDILYTASVEWLDTDILYGPVSARPDAGTGARNYGVFRDHGETFELIVTLGEAWATHRTRYFYEDRRLYTITRDGNLNCYDVDAADIRASVSHRPILPDMTFVDRIINFDEDRIYFYGGMYDEETGRPTTSGYTYFAVMRDGSGYREISLNDLP